MTPTNSRTTAPTTPPRLSSTRHRELLRRCAEDDAFRAELRRDAAGALARYGVTLGAGTLPAAVTLPPKGALRRALGHGDAEIDIPWMGLVASPPAAVARAAGRRG